MLKFLKEIKYSPTLLNVFCIGLLAYALFLYVLQAFDSTGAGGDAWGFVAVWGLILFALAGLLIDLVIQLLTWTLASKNHHLYKNLFSILILGLCFLFFTI